ncbi:MAG: hypothetical protein EAX95_08765 [Candidatus Thorarchaeota archaeon]|nr:hypothetical protein [Candidatus Thorarchaeota archaeon]
MLDLVVKNARLLLESGLTRGGIGVKDGKICLIARDEHLPEANTIIDASTNMLMPGLIDGHAHIHDPSMLDHEDFTTGTRAAAAGGITTVVDMPLTSQVDTPKLVDEKIDQGESMAVVDFSFYAGMINSENIPSIPLLIDKGIAAFKAFTCDPFYANNGVLLRAMSEVSERGGHLAVHAEDQGIIDEFAKDLHDDWDAPVSHALSRPFVAEQYAVRQMVDMAERTGGHLHIAHITTMDGIKEIERGKLRGVMVTTEVCPHHLVFHSDEMNRLGPKSKMNPPLRSKRDVAALWSALLRGTIDLAVTDHAPSPLEKKEAGREDIRNAWSGVDGLQMLLRILLSEGVNKGRITFQKLLRVASLNPAKIFGLYPKKGTLQIGSDADFVIFDPTLEETINEEMMFSKCGWTLYEGLRTAGTPLMTFVRGVQVFGDNRMLVKPGHGQFQPMRGYSAVGV